MTVLRIRRVLSALLVSLLTCAAVAEEKKPSLRLTLPPDIYAVAGLETGIDFDNIILTQTPDKYRFDVTGAPGKVEKTRWVCQPTAEDVGTHEMVITVADADGNRLGQAKSRLHVVPADAGKGKSVRVLIVGDSLTHASLYPNALARLLSQPGNPEWTMLGTHRPKQAQEGVAHEGYGGWTWERFVSLYNPGPSTSTRKQSSPFVYPDAAGKPKLDIARYLKETAGGQPPDVVFFLLGINDCFSADADDPDPRIESMFASAAKLLKAFREAAPQADLAICLTPAPNARDAAFEANYKGKYPRWGWKRIQHRLVERQIKQFGQQEEKRFFLVPTELNLDPVDGYPANNGVHPNAAGYGQIGASLYAWLKWRLQEEE